MATQSSIDIAQQMYVAYYGRPADPGGLAFWADVFDASDDLTTALTQFGDSAEFTNNFGNLSPSDLVSNLYQQMYGHAPDPGGLAFYLGRLDTGEATLASIAKQIADGSLDTDLTTLNNRITVANTFTNEVESRDAPYMESDIPTAQSLLAAVDENQSTVTAGNDAAMALVGDIAGDDAPAEGLFDMVVIYGSNQADSFTDLSTPDDRVYTALLFDGNDSMNVDNGLFALFGGQGSDSYQLGDSGGYLVFDAGGADDYIYIDHFLDNLYVSTINDGSVLIIESEEDDLYIFPGWLEPQNRLETWGLRDGEFSFDQVVGLVEENTLGDQPDSGAEVFGIPAAAVDPHIELFEFLGAVSSGEADEYLHGVAEISSNAMIDLFGLG